MLKLRAGVHVCICACVCVCISILLDIPQGTPALSGGLMWLVSVLIIAISHHASAAALPRSAQGLSLAPARSREDSSFTLCFTLVTFTTDELLVVLQLTPLNPSLHRGKCAAPPCTPHLIYVKVSEEGNEMKRGSH